MCDLSSSRAIVVALGGWQKMAAALGVHQSRTHRWQTEGIPHVRWPAVIRLAQQLDVPLTYEHLAEAFEKDDAIARTAMDTRNVVSGINAA